jgi:hypothetical protein
MEKVETLVVTVPMASPKDPPEPKSAWRREGAFRRREGRSLL